MLEEERQPRQVPDAGVKGIGLLLTRSFGNPDENWQHDTQEAPLGQDRSHVVQGIVGLNEGKYKGGEELSNSVPEPVRQNHGSADVDRTPLSHVNRQSSLNRSHTDAGQELGGRPVPPVSNSGLNGNRLDDSQSEILILVTGADLVENETKGNDSIANGTTKTHTRKDDPKQVHGHLSADPVRDGVQEDHADELPKGLHSTPEGGVVGIEFVHTLRVGKAQTVDEPLIGDNVS